MHDPQEAPVLRFQDLRYSVRTGRGKHVSQKSVLAGVSVRPARTVRAGRRQ
jgi:hypothetical protein